MKFDPMTTQDFPDAPRSLALRAEDAFMERHGGRGPRMIYAVVTAATEWRSPTFKLGHVNKAPSKRISGSKTAVDVPVPHA